LDTGERDTGGHNEGGASDHTGGTNQEQGRQSQGQEVQGNERQGLQNKTQKLRVMTAGAPLVPGLGSCCITRGLRLGSHPVCESVFL